MKTEDKRKLLRGVFEEITKSDSTFEKIDINYWHSFVFKFCFRDEKRDSVELVDVGVYRIEL